MTTKKLVVITAGLSQPSSSRLLADRLADATVRALAVHGAGAEVQVTELRDVAHDVTNNLLTGFAPPALAEVVQTLTSADALIAVTPIFTTSYSGLFKSFIDVLDPDSLADLPVLLGATGGTERHSLALDYSIRPLFTYLHARPVPTGVYAASSDWGSDEGDLQRRIERAAGELAAEVIGSRRTQVDPWALTTSFEDLLRNPS